MFMLFMSLVFESYVTYAYVIFSAADKIMNAS